MLLDECFGTGIIVVAAKLIALCCLLFAVDVAENVKLIALCCCCCYCCWMKYNGHLVAVAVGVAVAFAVAVDNARTKNALNSCNAITLM